MDGAVGVIRNIRPNNNHEWCLMVEWNTTVPQVVHDIEWSSAREINLHNISINPGVSKLFSDRRKQKKFSLEILQKVHMDGQ